MASPSRKARNGRAPDGTATRLMALSSAVIVAAYAVGYAHTEAAARQAAAATVPPGISQAATPGSSGAGASASNNAASTVSASGSSATSTSGGASAASGTSSAASKTAAAPKSSTTAKKTATKYRNGTFSAQGWGPHGPVTVAVVIRAGRIVSANITACGTTYPCNYISPLVNLVVQNQGPPTEYISGATSSSYAYYEAVTQALAKA